MIKINSYLAYTKKVFSVFFLTLFVLFSPFVVYAQVGDPDDPATAWPSSSAQPSTKGTSLADVCGQSADPNQACTANNFYGIAASAVSLLTKLGFSAAVVIISIRFLLAYKAAVEGDARSYHDALKAAWRSVSSIIIWVLLIGGFFATALQYFGVRGEYLKLIKPSSIFLIDRAYAQTACSSASVGKDCMTSSNESGKCSQALTAEGSYEYVCLLPLVQKTSLPQTGTVMKVNEVTDQKYTMSPTSTKTTGSQTGTTGGVQSSGGTLPNPVPQVTSLYDFLIQALRLVMRFFVYPALIVVWVWTGFAFVAAQGAPDALTKAKKYLVGAFITTVVVLCVHGFLVVLHASVSKVFGYLPDPGIILTIFGV